jgi:putative membrane protein
MTTRLWYGITWPSAVITLAMGISLLVNQPFWLNESFMIIKLVMVGLLYGYHFSLQYLFNQLRRNVVNYTSQHMRLWNEVATLFLIGIVFLIVLKSALSMVWGIVGLLAVTLLILLGINVYKRVRRN